MKFVVWEETDWNENITEYKACLPESLDNEGKFKPDAIVGFGECPLYAVSMLIEFLVMLKDEDFIFNYGVNKNE